MIWKASLVLSLALCVSSGRRPAVSEQNVERFYAGHHGDLSHIGHHEPEHHEVYAWAYPSYEFSYHVDDPHTHDKKGQHEIRDGDKVTGNYWLVQPDGRKRTVKYRSDHKSGFHAEVNYLPRDGHHHEMREHHHEKHGHEEEHKEIRHGRDERKEVYNDRRHDWDRRHDDENYGHKNNNRWEEDNREWKGEERHWDSKREERRDRKNDHDREEERGRGEDDKKQEGRRREEGDRREGRNRENEGNKMGIQSWDKERDDRKDDHRGPRREGIVGWRKAGGHEEHWKHGVLVGWTEGKGRGDRRRNDERRGRDFDRSHEDRRGQHSYQEPIMNFKSFVPYGQRLH